MGLRLNVSNTHQQLIHCLLLLSVLIISQLYIVQYKQILMKQQQSIGLLEEPDFASPLSINAISQETMSKFNNTVVLKKGQLTQVLKNSLAMQNMAPPSINKDVSPQRGVVNGAPRRNSRNFNRNQPVITNGSNGLSTAGGKSEQFAVVAHHMVGGPEADDSPPSGVIGKSGGISLEHFQYLQQQQQQQQQQPQQQLHAMNQTIRSPQQHNLAAVINNIKNNGSLRNLQNFRSKRMEKGAAGQQQPTQVQQDRGFHEQQQQQQQVVRAPPIQNGLYFSNIIQSVNGAQSQRYQQQPQPQQQQQVLGGGQIMISPRNHNNSKSNGGGHQKTQSMGDVSGVLKNIITQQTTMPNIVASPRNMAPPSSGQVASGVSIERINKNISDSIGKGGVAQGGGHNKEIQLIQAYQHQKWKEQITQRKNKNVALRSLDTTYQGGELGSTVSGATQGSQYILNTSREPSTKPQHHQGSNIVAIAQASIGGGIKAGANVSRPRVVPPGAPTAAGGSLTSRFPQGAQQQFEAGVFAYHDQSTYSSTIEDESRMMKTQIKFPMTSQEAFKILQPLLWDYEKTEVLEFETVYFFNVVERKKQSSEQRRTQASGGSSSTMMVMGSDNPKLINFGFDSENQEYNVVMHEHLAYRYEVVKKLGKGSFGIVLRVFDHKTKEFLALKILKNKKRLYKQGLVEAKLIETLNKADPEDKKNIIRKLDQFVFRKHLMITFEMLSINLYEFIKMNNFQGFSLNLIKRFAIQILIALFFMKEHNIVHCDMKPENILLRKINKSGIKIIDFGSGCFENEKIYTYIQSRFYRAPEIVLGIAYTTSIDMWSYGCILYELFVGYPLFPGEDEKEHMAMIMEVKGIPPRSVLARATRRKVFFDDDYQPILVPNTRGKIRNPNTKNLAALMNCPDRDFVDFVDKCIEWKVENRLTPEQAFSHPFIAKAVQELKGIRGQSETQKLETTSSQQQAKHPVQQPTINTGGTTVGVSKEMLAQAAASNSETLLPQINYKQ